MTTSETFSNRDRRALRSVAIQFFVNGAVFASFVPRFPEVRDRIDVSLDTLGLLITLALALGLLGSVIASRAIDLVGTRWVMILGAVVLTTVVPFIGFASGPVLFVAAYGIVTIADVVVDVAMNLQGSWLSGRRRIPVINRLHGLWSLGTVIGGLVSARAAASGVSLQTHLVVASAVLFVVVMFVGSGLLRQDEHVESPVADTGSGQSKNSHLAGLILLAMAGGFAVTTEAVSSDWAAFRLVDDFGTSAGFAGLGFVAFTSGMTGGRFCGDWASARFGTSKLLSIASLLAGVGLFGASLAPNRWIVLASYVLAGVGISTFFPKLYDDAAKFQARPGVGLAWMTGGTRIASLSIPSIVGFLAASQLSVGMATAIVTLPCVAGFVIASRRFSRR